MPGEQQSSIRDPLAGAALSVLGIDRLALGVHDLMLPSRPGEDTGRGSPSSRGGGEFFAFCAGMGFNALQLGPQGQTTADNPSPYDGAIFARNTAALALGWLEERDLLTAEEARRLTEGSSGSDRADHLRATRVTAEAIDLAWRCYLARRQDRPGPMALEMAAFEVRAGEWLGRDGLFEALAEEHGTSDPRAWPRRDRELFAGAGPRDDPGRHRELLERHARLIQRRTFGQFVLHLQHADFARSAQALGMQIYGDLQIGLPPRDAWAWKNLFLDDLVMGAPPSRTTPLGQPWGYPALNPEVDARAFVGLRIEKALAEYAGLRIDHPHGWVCPWVYDAAAAGSEAAVERGARLHESPDDPRVARFAIARREQLRRDLPPYDDGWVRELDEDQVDRYARLTNEILACADRVGRPRKMLLWELLSTQPYPLERFLQRQGLGRFRVTQKVRLGDPQDQYRSEHATPGDWIMLGNHDTQPIWAVVERWSAGGELEARARYLAERLCHEPRERSDFAARLASDPLLIAQAQFADLFASRARNVLVFVSDLLGETRWFNIPGVVDPGNWTLRVPRDYRRVYQERLAGSAALDLPLALALALEAKGHAQEQADLIRALRTRAHPSTEPRLRTR